MKKLVYAILISTLGACDGNYREVVISGQVSDSLTGNLISGTRVNITCWVYDTEIWESRKVIKDTLTDENGKFSFSFEKGEAIRVEVNHENYKPVNFLKTLDRNVNRLEFKLQKGE